MERDDGNLFVLEATMISLILLGAAYAVQSLQDASIVEERPRAELDRLVDDALTVLAGLDHGNGTSLDLYLSEALHCALDETPWIGTKAGEGDCDGRRSKNLSVKIESYLPLGAGYAVGIGNGAAVREVYRSPQPQGEAVSSSYTFAPNWSLGFLATDLSCYDASTDIRATLLPVHRASSSWIQTANLSLDVLDDASYVATETVGTRANLSSLPHAWNFSIASHPEKGTLATNVTGNATFRGSTNFTSCTLPDAPTVAAVRAALANVAFGPTASAVNLTQAGGFQAELAPLAGVPGLAVTRANVTLYAPVPPRWEGINANDSWIRAASFDLTGSGTLKSGSWTANDTMLYGLHPALLRVQVQLGGASFTLQKVSSVEIALPGGVTPGEPLVPRDPPYRATLQAWLPDWG